MSLLNWVRTHKLKSIFYAALAVILIDCLYLLIIWPDWKEISSGPIPESALIRDYRERAAADKSLPRLRWSPRNAPLPRHVVRPFIIAEDSRFYSHSGIDTEAIVEAAKYNWRRGSIVLGASTISQQTTKNLFLSTARTPWRKWHELILTFALEAHVTKNRILRIYLNIAEFGKGVYGIQAAARRYYGKAATALTTSEAAALAASLPGPRRHNPSTRTRFFRKRHQHLLTVMHRIDEMRSRAKAEAGGMPDYPATNAPLPMSPRTIRPARQSTIDRAAPLSETLNKQYSDNPGLVADPPRSVPPRNEPREDAQPAVFEEKIEDPRGPAAP